MSAIMKRLAAADITKRLASPVLEIRMAAIARIGDRRLSEFGPVLAEKLNGAEHWSVQKEAAIILGKIGGGNAAEVLAKRFTAAKPEVQKGIILGLVEANGERHILGIAKNLMENWVDCNYNIGGRKEYFELDHDVAKTIVEALKSKYEKLRAEPGSGQNGNGGAETMMLILQIYNILLDVYSDRWKIYSETICNAIVAAAQELGILEPEKKKMHGEGGGTGRNPLRAKTATAMKGGGSAGDDGIAQVSQIIPCLKEGAASEASVERARKMMKKILKGPEGRALLAEFCNKFPEYKGVVNSELARLEYEQI